MLHLLRLASRRSLAWAAALAAAGIALSRLPLFHVLGYEYAFAIGLVASFAAADLAAAQAARAPARGLLAHVAAGWLRMVVLLVVPLAIILVNGLFVRPCDTWGGLGFYLVLPGMSTLWGTVAGVVCATLFGRRRWLGGVAAWLTVAGSLALAVVRFYAAPPIFGYDPFGGYFPGALYDEDIRVPAALFAARAYQGAWAIAALGLAGLVRARRPAPLAAMIAGTIAALVLLHRSADLGFHVSSADIAAALGGRRETAHFIIYYPAGAAFEHELDAIAEDHEYRLAQVTRFFGVDPPAKITSFYFATAADKARWMGAENAYIAKPWRREIYISHEEFPHGALRHEIAHVVAGAFGDPVFHVSVRFPLRFNVGLIEGAAVAADWPGGTTLTPHQAVRAMVELGVLPPVERTLATSFFQFSSAQGYTTAGSFCRFLVDRYGAERFRALYRAGGAPADFGRIYGKELGALESEWRAEVLAAPLAERDLEIARERFRQKAIFYRPCPHAVAALRRNAETAARAGDAARALALWRKVCAEDPEPSYRVTLAGALERAGKADEARAMMAALAADAGLSTPLRARAALAEVDLLGRAGDLAGARAAVDAAAALPVDDTVARNLEVRRAAVADAPGAAELRAYLFGTARPEKDDDPADLLVRAERVAAVAPVGAYLVGRVHFLRGELAAAARSLAVAARAGIDLPLVRREIDRLLAPSAYLTGDLDAVRATADRLADPAAGQPLALRLWARDWLERLAFHRTGALLMNP
jgi:hypothetical protein